MSVVEPMGVELLDVLYSSIQINILLSPYLCFYLPFPPPKAEGYRFGVARPSFRLSILSITI